MMKKVSVLLLVACIYSVGRAPEQALGDFKGKTTVFVHGTLFFRFIADILHKFDIPYGLAPATELPNNNGIIHRPIARILDEQDSQQFPIEGFYYFGWSGTLGLSARRAAACDLYDAIKNLPRPITLIGHSHGGNVVLELAQVAEERGEGFEVDRVVFLATPVQVTSRDYIKSPVFQEIYALYSEGDLTQILDMQHRYTSECAGFLSQRVFEPLDHMKQARIMMSGSNPGHLFFIKKHLMQRLPGILSLMRRSDRHTGIINTFPDRKPVWVEKKCVGKRNRYVEVGG